MANGRCKRVFRKFCTYILLLLIFVVGGGVFEEVVCVFEVFVIAFCFGEFVGVFVFAFGGDRESDEEVRFLQFLLFLFFLFPGFFWVGTVLMGCTNLQVMNEEAAALIFSSLSRSS